MQEKSFQWSKQINSRGGGDGGDTTATYKYFNFLENDLKLYFIC